MGINHEIGFPFTFFIPLFDGDVPAEHRATLAKYRQLASEHGVPTTTPVCYCVRAGFTLKTHAPNAGPCYQGFSYLQGWNFPDEPSADSLVFWVPRILNGSTSKTKDQQRTFLADLGRKLELPAHHLNGFGKVALIAGLILAYYKVTGKRIPLNKYWVRTDTCLAGRRRLLLGYFNASGLLCHRWLVDARADDYLGMFAIGVETLGG